MKYKPTIDRKTALKIAYSCVNNTVEQTIELVREIARKIRKSSKRMTWKGELLRFADCMENGTIYSTIFNLKGNQKLPDFAAFSTLPIVTCPGMGDCGTVCYSLRAWRYPVPFLRQCQNTIYLIHDRSKIEKAFHDIPQNLVLRLYVDGDFDSVQTARFWFRLLKTRLDVTCYGYSKSWDELLAVPHDEIPSNYRLNVSSGSCHDDTKKKLILESPLSRGEFIYLPIEGNFARGSARYDDPNYHAAVREGAKALGILNAFSCPGHCDACPNAVKNDHVCGGGVNGQFEGMVVAIGIHK